VTSLEIRDPRVTAVVGPDVTFEKIAGGCLFTEGPLWHPRERFLLWSDMPGDHLRRWSAADGVTTFREPCGKSNGLTWDREGRLLACEHATSQVTVTLADGSTKPLATHWNGQQLNSPNDIVCAADGGIYFSDPPYGRAEFFGVPRAQELSFQGVFRVGPDPRSPTLLVDDFDRPNGLCSQENVYCCGPGGIHVFGPDAVDLGVIRVPEYTANFAFGDDDLCSLYITASTSVYRIRVRVPGPSAL